MKKINNKQHEYILKAYTSSRFPRLIYENLSDTILVFEEIDSYAIDVLKGKQIVRPEHKIISKEMKMHISQYLDNAQIDQDNREEMLIFYRLSILVTGILEYYFN